VLAPAGRESEPDVLVRELDVEPGLGGQVEDERSAAVQEGRPDRASAITSTASSRAMPPRSASSTPSLKASICEARLMLTASLSRRPWPFGPTCLTT
jgi:hypothetical protein